MKWNDFVEEILTYESDTFSAEGSKITRIEAEQVAEKMLDSFERHLDGVSIDAYLEEIRDE